MDCKFPQPCWFSLNIQNTPANNSVSETPATGNHETESTPTVIPYSYGNPIVWLGRTIILKGIQLLNLPNTSPSNQDLPQ